MAEKKAMPTWVGVERNTHIQANYVLGGCAGIMATTCVQPLDLIKTRMQLR